MLDNIMYIDIYMLKTIIMFVPICDTCQFLYTGLVGNIL